MCFRGFPVRVALQLQNARGGGGGGVLTFKVPCFVDIPSMGIRLGGGGARGRVKAARTLPSIQ